jgi:hypothetical protein
MLSENEKKDLKACTGPDYLLEVIKIVAKHTQERGYLNDLGCPTKKHWKDCKTLLDEELAFVGKHLENILRARSQR